MPSQSFSVTESSAAVPPVSPSQLASTDAEVVLRTATADDAAECGRICFEAFRHISGQHNFPADFPHAEAAVQLFDFMLAQPDIYVVVAERDGRVIASNALWQQTPIAAVGPITVDPGSQNAALGRALMSDVMRRAETSGARGIRLVQAAYHGRSLSLYTKLGFDAREPLSVMQGPALAAMVRGRTVRPAVQADIPACAALHERLHGFSRVGELAPAIAQGTATVVEHRGRISGYATQVGFFGHAVGVLDSDIAALIGAAPEFPGPGFMVPTRNAALMRWCLDHGLRIVQPMTLMTKGTYHKPSGSYLPSVLF